MEPTFCKRCDGYGVVANRWTGMTEECPDCDGRHLTNDEVRATRSAAPSPEAGE